MAWRFVAGVGSAAAVRRSWFTAGRSPATLITLSGALRVLFVDGAAAPARDELRSMAVLQRADRRGPETDVRPPDIGSGSQNDLWLTRLRARIIRLPWPDSACAVVN